MYRPRASSSRSPRVLRMHGLVSDDSTSTPRTAPRSPLRSAAAQDSRCRAFARQLQTVSATANITMPRICRPASRRVPADDSRPPSPAPRTISTTLCARLDPDRISPRARIGYVSVSTALRTDSVRTPPPDAPAARRRVRARLDAAALSSGAFGSLVSARGAGARSRSARCGRSSSRIEAGLVAAPERSAPRRWRTRPLLSRYQQIFLSLVDDSPSPGRVFDVAISEPWASSVVP